MKPIGWGALLVLAALGVVTALTVMGLPIPDAVFAAGGVGALVVLIGMWED
jgi:hypothetical protein